MANAFYQIGMQSLAEGDLGSGGGWDGDTFAAYLVDTADYAVNLATHDFVNDITAGVEEGPVTIGSRTVALDGILDGADIVFTSAAGDPCEAIIIADTEPGSDATNPLFIYIDTATGLPVTLNGGNVTVVWDDGTNKIAKI